MENLVQIALHRFAVRPYGLTHDRSRRARRCEQCLNKPPGLSGVQFDLVAIFNNLAGHCNRVQGDKLGHRAALNGGGLAEKLLVRRGTRATKRWLLGSFSVAGTRQMYASVAHKSTINFNAPRLHRRPACRAARHRVVRGAWLAGSVGTGVVVVVAAAAASVDELRLHDMLIYWQIALVFTGNIMFTAQ